MQERKIIDPHTKQPFEEMGIIHPETGRPMTEEDVVLIRRAGKKVEIAAPPSPNDYREYGTTENAGGLVIMMRPEFAAASSAEIKSRKKEAEAEAPIPEYFDFSPELIQEVEKTHKSKLTNLFSGHNEQFANYLSSILEKIGFEASNAARRLLTSFIKGGVDITYISTGLTHPHPEISEKRLGRAGETVIREKKYNSPATYNKLSLLLMPHLWENMSQSQKISLLEGLKLVLHSTKNISEAKAGELYLRLAELADTADRGLRVSIYQLLDLAPYEQLPEKAKEAAALSMAEFDDYSSGLALSFLNDESGNEVIKKMQEAYQEFEKSVLKEISQPKDTLSAYNREKWLDLARKVKKLNIIGIDDPAFKDKYIGFELETMPFDEASDRAKEHLRQVDFPGKDNLLTSGTDGNWLELRTRDGGMPFTKTAFYAIKNALDVIEREEPGWALSAHFHIDKDLASAEKIKEFFVESRTDTRHNTHELRSLPAPTSSFDDGENLIKSKYKFDIVRLGQMAAFCASLDEAPEKMEVREGANLRNYSDEEAMRKLFSLAAFGDNPKQRAAAMYVMETSPAFFNLESAVKIIARQAETGKRADIFESFSRMVYEEKLPEYVAGLVQHGGEAGMRLAISKFNEVNDHYIKDEIIQSLAQHGGEAGAQLLISKFDEIADADKGHVIWSLAEFGGEAGMRFAISKFDEIADDGIRAGIIEHLFRSGNEAGIRFAISKFDEIADADKGYVIWSLSRDTIGEAGMRFLISKFDEIAGYYAKSEIIRYLSQFGGEAGMRFLISKFDEINDNYIKGNIIRYLSQFGGEAGIQFVISKFDEINDNYIKGNIIQSLAQFGGEAGIRFAISKFDEISDFYARGEIIQSLAQHGGEAGMRFLISKFDELLDDYTKGEIIRSLAEFGGGKAIKFVSAQIDILSLDNIRQIICKSRDRNIKKIILDLYNAAAWDDVKEFLRNELEIRE